MILQINETGKRTECKDLPLVQLKKLWDTCFHDTKAYMDFYFQWKAEDNLIYAVRQNGKPVSMLHLNPYQLMVNGTKISSYYIVGVATDPDYRRQGLMRRLLQSAMQRMHQEGVPFTYLMPAREQIYTPYDFQTIGSQERPQNLEQIKAEGGSDCRIIPADNQQELELLAAFANHFLRERAEIYTVRSVSYYQRMLAELEAMNGSMLAIYDEEQLRGYAAFAVENGTLEVTECLSEEEWYKPLLANVIQTARRQAEDPMLSLMQTAPLLMTRIIHVEQFASLLRATRPVTITIEVQDDWVKENVAVYEFHADEQGCRAVRIKGAKMKADVCCGIGELTAFFFGVCSAKKLATEKEKIEKLELFQPFRRVYLNEIV